MCIPRSPLQRYYLNTLIFVQYSVTAGYLGIGIEKSKKLGLNQEIWSQPRLLIKQTSLNVIRVPP